MTSFLILFAILLLLAFLSNYFLIRSFLGFRWRFFVAPGVIFHELCHAFGCLICGAKIVHISFFDKDGGSVTYQKPFVPILGPILISLAPLILGILAFYFLGNFIQLENTLNLSAFYSNTKSLIHQITHSWSNLIIIYLLISVSITFTPSRQDLLNMLIPVIILAIIFYLISHFTAFGFSHFDFIFTKLSLVLNMVIFILIVFLIISLLFYLVTKLVLKR